MTEPARPTIHVNSPAGDGPDSVAAEWRVPSRDVVEGAALAALATVPARDAEISISFVSAASIRALNRDYHAADEVTDVLAFPLGEHPLLGDIYISPEVAGEYARAHGLDPDEEILRLVIHGVLHLLGHDHPNGDGRYASPMFRLQERLLAEFRGRP